MTRRRPAMRRSGATALAVALVWAGLSGSWLQDGAFDQRSRERHWRAMGFGDMRGHLGENLLTLDRPIGRVLRRHPNITASDLLPMVAKEEGWLPEPGSVVQVAGLDADAMRFCLAVFVPGEMGTSWVHQDSGGRFSEGDCSKGMKSTPTPAFRSSAEFGVPPPRWNDLSHDEFFTMLGAQFTALAAMWFESVLAPGETNVDTFDTGEHFGGWTVTESRSTRGPCVSFAHPELDGNAVYGPVDEVNRPLPRRSERVGRVSELFARLRVGDARADRHTCGDRAMRVTPRMRALLIASAEADEFRARLVALPNVTVPGVEPRQPIRATYAVLRVTALPFHDVKKAAARRIERDRRSDAASAGRFPIPRRGLSD